jgi:ADP-ribosylglycohydrolase
MRCFYESTDYESFMRNIFSLECDSDTFGAIAGGVAEEFYHGFGDVDAEGILGECLDEYLTEILVS